MQIRLLTSKFLFYRTKNNHINWYVTVFIKFCLLFLISLASQAKTNQLIIGVYDQKPDIYVTADGRISGILGEVLTEIARSEKWQLKIEKCSWQACMDSLAAGSIDILPDVYYTPERSKQFSFHHIPALHSWSQIYARPGHKIMSIQDLEGLKIATLAGSTQNEYIKNALTSLDIKAKLYTEKYLKDGFKKTEDQEYDAIASDYYIGQLKAKEHNLVATPIIFQPTQAFFATPKGKHPEALATIDKYLGRWLGEPGSFYYRVLENWRTPVTNTSLGVYGLTIISILLASLGLTILLALWFKRRYQKERSHVMLSERHLNDIIDSIDAFVSVKDKNFRYVYANKKLADFYKAKPEDLIGKRDVDFMTDLNGLATLRKNDKHVLDKHERVVIEHRVTGVQETQAKSLLTIKAPMRNSQGEVAFVCSVATDISSRLHAEEAAYKLMFFDSLTDLPNRKTTLEKLVRLIDKVHTDKTVGALVQINIDGFKKINEMHGYYVGDQVLCEIARRLLLTMRKHDVITRTNSDEFVVILDLLGDKTDVAAQKAMHVAEKIWLSITSEPVHIDDIQIHIPTSIGLTLIHAKTPSLDSVMREADMAVSESKLAGGNKITFYEKDLQKEIEQRMWMEHDLLQAINTPQLAIYIQPQFDPKGKVTGAELLSRWNHPTRGAVSPNLFISIAEQSGLISILGDWTIRKACKISLKLQDMGKTYPLSINISPRQLMDPKFTINVSNILDVMGVPGNRLIFEITESVLIHDIEAVSSRMHELALLGIRFSIDDFGTGYSNLAYLKRLPLYELKIDKSLIQDIPNDNDSSAIAKLILAMAEQLGLRVVAEGVEIEQQAQFLYINQCHSLQGYLFAKPMPIDDWLKTESEPAKD